MTTDTVSTNIANNTNNDLVHSLSSMGRPKSDCDYLALGFDDSHLAALIQLVEQQTCVQEMEDEDNDEEFNTWCASIHAWRVLGQLKNIQAAPVLIKQLALGYSHDVDWAFDLIPIALAGLGPEVFPLLEKELLAEDKLKQKLLEEESSEQGYGALEERGVVFTALSRVGAAHESIHAQAVAITSQELSVQREEAYDYNTALIECLVTLKAAESIDIIRAVWAADIVETSWYGSIEEIEFQLGLGDEPVRRELPLEKMFGGSMGPSPDSETGTRVLNKKQTKARKKSKAAKKQKQKQQQKKKAKKKKKR